MTSIKRIVGSLLIALLVLISALLSLGVPGGVGTNIKVRLATKVTKLEGSSLEVPIPSELLKLKLVPQIFIENSLFTVVIKELKSLVAKKITFSKVTTLNTGLSTKTLIVEGARSSLSISSDGLLISKNKSVLFVLPQSAYLDEKNLKNSLSNLINTLNNSIKISLSEDSKSIKFSISNPKARQFFNGIRLTIGLVSKDGGKIYPVTQVLLDTPTAEQPPKLPPITNITAVPVPGSTRLPPIDWRSPTPTISGGATIAAPFTPNTLTLAPPKPTKPLSGSDSTNVGEGINLEIVSPDNVQVDVKNDLCWKNVCIDQNDTQYDAETFKVLIPQPDTRDDCRENIYRGSLSCTDINDVSYYKKNGCIYVGFDPDGWLLGCSSSSVLNGYPQSWNDNISEYVKLFPGHNAELGHYVSKLKTGPLTLIEAAIDRESRSATKAGTGGLTQTTSTLESDEGTQNPLEDPFSASKDASQIKIDWSQSDSKTTTNVQLNYDETLFYTYEKNSSAELNSPNFHKIDVQTQNTSSILAFTNPSDRELCVNYLRMPQGLLPLEGLPQHLTLAPHSTTQLKLSKMRPVVYARSDTVEKCENSISRIKADPKSSTMLEAAMAIGPCRSESIVRVLRIPIQDPEVKVRNGQLSSCDLEELRSATAGTSRKADVSPIFKANMCPQGMISDPPTPEMEVLRFTLDEDTNYKCICKEGEIPNPNPPEMGREICFGDNGDVCSQFGSFDKQYRAEARADDKSEVSNSYLACIPEPDKKSHSDDPGSGAGPGGCGIHSHPDKADVNMCECDDDYVVPRAGADCEKKSKCKDSQYLDVGNICSEICPDPGTEWFKENNQDYCRCAPGYYPSAAQAGKCIKIPDCPAAQHFDATAETCVDNCDQGEQSFLETYDIQSQLILSWRCCPMGSSVVNGQCITTSTIFSCPQGVYDGHGGCIVNDTCPKPSSLPPNSATTSSQSNSSAAAIVIAGSSNTSEASSGYTVSEYSINRGPIPDNGAVSSFSVAETNSSSSSSNCKSVSPAISSKSNIETTSESHDLEQLPSEGTPASREEELPKTKYPRKDQEIVIIPPIDATPPSPPGSGITPPKNEGETSRGTPVRGAQESDPIILIQVLKLNPDAQAEKWLESLSNPSTSSEERSRLLEEIKKWAFGDSSQFDWESIRKNYLDQKLKELSEKGKKVIEGAASDGFWSSTWNATFNRVGETAKLLDEYTKAAAAIFTELNRLLENKQISPIAYYQAWNLTLRQFDGLLSTNKNLAELTSRINQSIFAGSSYAAHLVNSAAIFFLAKSPFARGSAMAESLLVSLAVINAEYFKALAAKAIDSDGSWSDKIVDGIEGSYKLENDPEYQKRVFKEAFHAGMITYAIMTLKEAGKIDSFKFKLEAQSLATTLQLFFGAQMGTAIVLELQDGFAKLIAGVQLGDETLQKEGTKDLANAGIDLAQLSFIWDAIEKLGDFIPGGKKLTRPEWLNQESFNQEITQNAKIIFDNQISKVPESFDEFKIKLRLEPTTKNLSEEQLRELHENLIRLKREEERNKQKDEIEEEGDLAGFEKVLQERIKTQVEEMQKQASAEGKQYTQEQIQALETSALNAAREVFKAGLLKELKEHFPTYSPTDWSSTVKDLTRRIAENGIDSLSSKELISRLLPKLKELNKAQYENAVERAKQALSAASSKALESQGKNPPKLKQEKIIEEPHLPDSEGRYGVIKKLNPSATDNRSVRREKEEGIWTKELGYKKNPNAFSLNDFKVDEAGNLLHPGGNVLRNGQYIYVVIDGANGAKEMIIGTRTKEALPHPTLVGGLDPKVYAAGEIKVENGKITVIDNQSGHFRPEAGTELIGKETLQEFGEKWQTNHPDQDNPFDHTLPIPWEKKKKN